MHEGKLRELLANVSVNVVHKNHRGWLVCPCPFAEFLHDSGTDSNPSFFVKIDPTGYSAFNCFTCHVKGNLTKLLDKLGYYREEDYQRLAIRALMDETPNSFANYDEARDELFTATEEGLDPIEKEIYLRMYPLAWEHPEGRKYLRGRDILESTTRLLDLRFDPDEMRILFPVYDHDENLYGFSGRSILSRQWTRRYPKVRDYGGLKKDKLILGENLIQDTKPLLVVEGLFAYASMMDLGVRDFCNPVATLGSHTSLAQRDILIDYAREVIYLYDDDSAGRKGLWGIELPDGTYEGGGAIDLLANHIPLAVARYPEGYTDPDNLSYQHVHDIVVGGQVDRY